MHLYLASNHSGHVLEGNVDKKHSSVHLSTCPTISFRRHLFCGVLPLHTINMVSSVNMRKTAVTLNGSHEETRTS